MISSYALPLDKWLVADKGAAAAGEDGRPTDQARAVLLVPVGRGPSDRAAVWSHAGQDRSATVASRVLFMLSSRSGVDNGNFD
jgi:hypothetical protein